MPLHTPNMSSQSRKAAGGDFSEAVADGAHFLCDLAPMRGELMGGAWERPMEHAGTPLRLHGVNGDTSPPFRIKQPGGPLPRTHPLGPV